MKKTEEKMNKYKSILEALGFDIENLPEDLEDPRSVLNTLDISAKLQIYRNLDLYFRTIDVEDYMIGHGLFDKINPDKSDCIQIAQNLIDGYDCNLSFNDQLEHFINEYFNLEKGESLC